AGPAQARARGRAAGCGAAGAARPVAPPRRRGRRPSAGPGRRRPVPRRPPRSSLYDCSAGGPARAAPSRWRRPTHRGRRNPGARRRRRRRGQSCRLDGPVSALGADTSSCGASRPVIHLLLSRPASVFLLIGLAVVIGSVLLGYVAHHGQLIVLWQWTEFVIIGGAGLGALLVGNSPSVVKAIGRDLVSLLKPNQFSEKSYAQLLQVLYDIFQKARKDGLVGLEAHIEEPE